MIKYTQSMLYKFQYFMLVVIVTPDLGGKGLLEHLLRIFIDQTKGYA